MIDASNIRMFFCVKQWGHWNTYRRKGLILPHSKEASISNSGWIPKITSSSQNILNEVEEGKLFHTTPPQCRSSRWEQLQNYKKLLNIQGISRLQFHKFLRSERHMLHIWKTILFSDRWLVPNWSNKVNYQREITILNQRQIWQTIVTILTNFKCLLVSSFCSILSFLVNRAVLIFFKNGLLLNPYYRSNISKIYDLRKDIDSTSISYMVLYHPKHLTNMSP